MMAYEPDPDVVRWGLQDLKVCTVGNSGCCSSVTRYQEDSVTHGYVREGYNEPMTGFAESDAVISQLYQEELSRVAQAEASGVDSPSGSCVVAQEWYHRQGQENQGRGTDNPGERGNDEDFVEMNDTKDPRTGSQEGGNSPTRDISLMDDDDSVGSVEIEEDSSSLDGEVGKRLNHMVPVPHVPKVNGELPSEDEQISDHERLLQRLQLYDLVENKVQGDGNCQFRSLSDQLYRSPDHHKSVREQVVHQLVSNREMYEGYVPMAYDDYLKKMRRNGEWGDHVTLQAAADWFGVRIFVITSFKDTCYIEILPHIQKSNRLICLSFWAEVHYNSIYPEGEPPVSEGKKKKKWWPL